MVLESFALILLVSKRIGCLSNANIVRKYFVLNILVSKDINALISNSTINKFLYVRCVTKSLK